MKNKVRYNRLNTAEQDSILATLPNANWLKYEREITWYASQLCSLGMVGTSDIPDWYVLQFSYFTHVCKASRCSYDIVNVFFLTSSGSGQMLYVLYQCNIRLCPHHKRSQSNVSL